MSKLNISLVQANLAWHQPQQNRDHLRLMLERVSRASDLVVLPEMFTTGFTMQAAEFAESMDGPSVSWMRERARELDAALCGSLIVVEDGKYLNRFVLAEPDGTLNYYDKRHLFAMAGEHDSYTAGRSRQVINFRGWRICPMICYDLRFPVWSRNDLDYDLLVYVANWPSRRRSHWKALAMARAIENQCYVATVNRVGADAKGLEYLGDSSLVDFTGEVQWCCEANEDVHNAILDRSAMVAYRQRFPFLRDRDLFSLD
jgi:omega-amidase